MNYFLSLGFVVYVIGVLDIFKHECGAKSPNNRRHTILSTHIAYAHDTCTLRVELGYPFSSLVGVIHLGRIIVLNIVFYVFEEYCFWLRLQCRHY